MIVTLQEVAQIQNIDVHRLGPLILDHLRFHNHVIISVFDLVVVLADSGLAGLHHVQDTLSFKKGRGFRSPYYYPSSRKIHSYSISGSNSEN